MYEGFFIQRMHQLRTAKGFTARDMSLSLGMSENYINSIENGMFLPSMEMFFNICEYLQVTPEEFFHQETESPTLSEIVLEDLKQLDESRLLNLHEIIKGLKK